ncbi:MAG: hypothetical protein HDT43_06935 [Ruminococcaceae bacterium]|nr:hypothetical protein [Oscillospiraceae bacterium]
MKRLQFFGIRHSFSTPKGFSFTEQAKDIRNEIRVKRVFSPRLADNIFAKKQKIR